MQITKEECENYNPFDNKKFTSMEQVEECILNALKTNTNVKEAILLCYYLNVVNFPDFDGSNFFNDLKMKSELDLIDGNFLYHVINYLLVRKMIIKNEDLKVGDYFSYGGIVCKIINVNKKTFLCEEIRCSCRIRVNGTLIRMPYKIFYKHEYEEKKKRRFKINDDYSHFKPTINSLLSFIII